MNNTFMKERPVFPLLMSMALPNVISMLVNSLYNIVDSLFVARINESAMTALSLVFPVQNLLNAIAIGFGIGINALVALCLGAGEHEKADQAATHGMAFSLLHGILGSAIAIAIMPSFLGRFTTDAEVLSMGLTYSYIVFGFATVNMASLAFEKIFQSVGRMKVTMVALIVGCVGNIILDPLLIFGIGPFPAMGIAGAALATGIGQALSTGVYLVVYASTELPVRLRRACLKLDKELDTRLYSIGIPAILNLALPSLLVTFLNSLLAAFSGSYVVVLGIYYKLQTFLYLPANGIVQGMRPLISYNYGAGEHKRVRQLYQITLILSAAIMAAGTLGCLAASEPLMRLFTSTPETVEAGKNCSADHLPGLCDLRHLHHLFRRAGGSGQGHAVAGDLPVPLHRLHHAAGLGALPTVWPCGRLERVLGHGSALRHRFPYRLQKERLTRFPYPQKRLRACTPLSQGGRPGAFSVSAQGLVFIWCAARCSGRPIQSAYPVPPRGQRSFWPYGPYACGSASVRGMLPPAARLPCRRRAPRAGCPWAQRP